MNSHILIPKVILKHFALQGGSLFYYDIKSGEVKRGYAATLNTQKGYYSSEVEKFLSANIESPMGKIIGILQKAYNDLFKTNKVEMTFYAQNIKALKNYVYSLITRSRIIGVANGALLARQDGLMAGQMISSLFVMCVGSIMPVFYFMMIAMVVFAIYFPISEEIMRKKMVNFLQNNEIE